MTRENFGTVREELNTMVATFGFEIERLIFQQVLAAAKAVKSLTAPEAGAERTLLLPLESEFQKLTHAANFVSLASDTEVDEEYLTRLCDRVIPIAAQAALAVSLAHSSAAPCRDVGVLTLHMVRLLSKKVPPAITATAVMELPDVVLRHLALVLQSSTSLALSHVKLVAAAYRNYTTIWTPLRRRSAA